MDNNNDRFFKTGQLKTGKTKPGPINLNSCRGTQMVAHQQNECMDPTCLVATVLVGGGGVTVGGLFFFSKLNTNQSSL